MKFRLLLLPLFVMQGMLYGQAKDPRFFTHLSLNGLYTAYSNNRNHTKNTEPLFAGSIAARQEWRFAKSGALVAGAEFLAHGLRFRSYFFAPGRSELYNKDFDYRYKVNIYELNFPLLIRANLAGRKRKPVEGYFEIGATLRYLYSARIKVNDSTNIVLSEKKTVPEFENTFFSKRLSLFMQLNTGLNFFPAESNSGIFVELNMRYAPVRFLVKESYTPNSLYIQNFHIGMGIGYRI